MIIFSSIIYMDVQRKGLLRAAGGLQLEIVSIPESHRKLTITLTGVKPDSLKMPSFASQPLPGQQLGKDGIFLYQQEKKYQQRRISCT